MKYYVLVLVMFAIAVGVVVLFSSRQAGVEIKEVVTTDTIRHTDTITRPVPYPAHIIVHTPPAQIDTAAVIAAYFESRVYNDTLVNTPLLTVSVADTVRENALQGRKVSYTYAQTEATVTRTITTKNRIMLHADTRGALSLSWQRGKLIFTGGYDAVTGRPMAGIGIQIFEK